MTQTTAFLTASIKRWNPDKQCYNKEEEFLGVNHNVTTNVLRDQLSDRLYTRTTNDGPRGAGFMALSTEGTTPVASDTTLAGESSASGLARVESTTKTHTAGTNVTVVSHQYTAGAAATITKAAIFTASSAGNMYHAAMLPSNAVLAINDLLTVTFTITHA